jgi:hypothetical protein
MKTSAQFIAQLLTEFPELRDEIESDEGLLHMQMGSFSRTTQEAITAGDFETLRRQFSLANSFFREGTPDLQNAFYVSYLEHLDFDGANGQRAKALMPMELHKGWQEIMEYWDELFRTAERKKPKID